MRTIVVAALAAAAVALPAATASTGTGLYGTVYRGPTKPVCQQGVPCSEPAAGLTLVFTRVSGTASLKTVTRQNGAYRIALRPGRYSVRTTQKLFGRVPKPSLVRVPSARWAHVNFQIDTGIR